jgi:hypothetical protein
MSQIKSDGGSTAYYDIRIPAQFVKLIEEDGKAYALIQTEDVIDFALDGDFHKGEIFKALKRMGQKEGVSDNYNLNKIDYRTNRIRDLNNVKNTTI